MNDLHNSFVTKSFLRSIWALDYEAFKDSEEEKELLERLNRWSDRTDLKETSAESAFLEEFFRQTWGYVQAGQDGSEASFSIYPKFPISGGGARGGVGEADAALGTFASATENLIPQVVCEFKDIKSALDAPQKRKGNTRSPVKQGLDYLSAARRDIYGTEPIQPTWAIVTDMNEFRLYWSDRAHQQFVRFTIRPADLFQGPQLLAETEEARFDRFLFFKLFHRDTLLVRGAAGKSLLAQLIGQQWVKERELENEFYLEYKAYRQHLYQALLEHNAEGTNRFPGTRGRLVRLAQRILDRCLFIFFCEDMGRALGFPPQLLRDFLIHESNDQYYDPNGMNIWGRLIRLFNAMNDGSAFGPNTLNRFNGGLFATDEALEKLHVPNRVFCQQGQGQNEANLYSHPKTLLYLSASYNYASGWEEGLTRPPLTDADGGDDATPRAKRDPSRSLGLYTLGRIFEQSITELEILEAEADGRTSVNKESKRKRDGVYYTPEWVVDRIVDETLGGRLADLKAECGWPVDGFPDQNAINTYRTKLSSITVVDPACGSGAFLITALRYLLDEWNALRELEIDAALDAMSDAERQNQGGITAARKKFRQARQTRDDSTLIRDILRDNLYGVDINAASVEITKLALWLHTARGDKPLSSLDDNIQDGNSLIGPSFYNGLLPYGDEDKERINAFDWDAAYPDVFAAGGFDVVLGNPPYVKLQNFRKAHADMAEFLKTDRAGNITYESTQTGNFDLYLPFIEKGVQLLNEQGRLGYIAPSVWIMNEYGDGLRQFIERNRQLYGWIDFQSFQIFDEATTYTALQFFSRTPNDAVKLAIAGNGFIPDDPWTENDARLPYERLPFGNRWLLRTGDERDLIEKINSSGTALGRSDASPSISQGIISGAFPIYSLRRTGENLYVNDSFPEMGEINIEDGICLRLATGEDVKRYADFGGSLSIIFPYKFENGKVNLLEPDTFSNDYPAAWRYIKLFEDELRQRDGGSMDSDGWYGYSRNQNLSKQSMPKLLVAGTAPELRLMIDVEGVVAANDKRVYTILHSDTDYLTYLMGILNSKVSNFFFKRFARPKANGFFDIEAQFLAPLPIPQTDDAQQQDVGDRALMLQQLHTRRRDLIATIARRTGTLKARNKPVSWLFPELTPARDLESEAPARLDAERKRAWAKDRYEQELAGRYDTLTPILYPGVAMSAEFSDGELKFLVEGTPIVDRIFLSDEEGSFIVAQWKLLSSTFSVTEKTTGKKLCNALRKIGETPNQALIDQIIQLQSELARTEHNITTAESEINTAIYQLYRLTDGEISIVERG